MVKYAAFPLGLKLLITHESHIEPLYLSFCENITDVGLAHVGKLSNLTTLNLYRSPNITGAGVAKLKEALPMCRISHSAFCVRWSVLFGMPVSSGFAILTGLASYSSMDKAKEHT